MNFLLSKESLITSNARNSKCSIDIPIHCVKHVSKKLWNIQCNFWTFSMLIIKIMSSHWIFRCSFHPTNTLYSQKITDWCSIIIWVTKSDKVSNFLLAAIVKFHSLWIYRITYVEENLSDPSPINEYWNPYTIPDFGILLE